MFASICTSFVSKHGLVVSASRAQTRTRSQHRDEPYTQICKSNAQPSTCKICFFHACPSRSCANEPILGLLARLLLYIITVTTCFTLSQWLKRGVTLCVSADYGSKQPTPNCHTRFTLYLRRLHKQRYLGQREQAAVEPRALRGSQAVLIICRATQIPAVTSYNCDMSFKSPSDREHVGTGRVPVRRRVAFRVGSRCLYTLGASRAFSSRPHLCVGSDPGHALHAHSRLAPNVCKVSRLPHSLAHCPYRDLCHPCPSSVHSRSVLRPALRRVHCDRTRIYRPHLSRLLSSRIRAYISRTLISFWDTRAPWSDPSSEPQHVSQVLTCREADTVARRRMADSARWAHDALSTTLTPPLSVQAFGVVTRPLRSISAADAQL
jgi:hypothetical protein